MQDDIKPEQFKRALCDSDFDGCVCAAIIKEVFPDIELTFTDPGSVQSGRFDKWVGADTIIADLPYVVGAGLYFDHHVSNKPQVPFVGCWQPISCAAEILIKYFEQKIDIAKYQKIVTRLSAFDSGAVTLEDIKNPDIYMQIGFAIDRHDKEFQKFFAEYLSKHSWEELISHEKVVKKLEISLQEREAYCEYAQKNTEIKSGVAFLDMKDYQGHGGHSFFVGMLFPNSKGIVIIKHDKKSAKFNLFHNIFNLKQGKSIDFLKIARTINPEASGGHTGACGCNIPFNKTVNGVVRQILSLLDDKQVAC